VTLSRLTLVGVCIGRLSNLITCVSINDLRVIYGGEHTSSLDRRSDYLEGSRVRASNCGRGFKLS
jgi:hypothetical protein